MASRIRINFHSDSEAMINKQINMELYASYVYMAMVSKIQKDNILNRICEIFGAVIFKVIEAIRKRPWVKNWEFGSDFFFLNILFYHYLVFIATFKIWIKVFMTFVKNACFLTKSRSMGNGHKCKQLLFGTRTL